MKQLKIFLLASMVMFFTAYSGGSSSSSTKSIIPETPQTMTIDKIMLYTDDNTHPVLTVGNYANVGKGPIKIGWAEIDITPLDTFLPIELGGQNYTRLTSTIHDPLTATAIAIESESGEQWILVSIDTLALALSFEDRGMLIPLRDSLQGTLSNFDLNKLTLIATHTHNAPLLRYNPYFDFVKEKLKIVVQQAWNNRVPGGISFEKGSAAVGFCRIVKYTDGHHKMYGDTTRSDFDGMLTPYDHTLELMYTFNSNGVLTGIMINIVSPAQLVENKWYISADFWHDVKQKLRETYGNELFILPYSGAAGDMSPHNLESIQATRDEMGEMIANSVRERYPFAINTIKYQIKMGHAIRNVNLTTKSYYQVDNPLYSKPRPVYLAEIHAVRLNNTVWVNNPFELYNAWGEAIKNASIATQTIIAQMSGLTYGGYLPTLEAVYGGAYGGKIENGWCDDIGGMQLVDNSVTMINGLFENNDTAR